jgi:hypothetical protein
MGGRNDSGITHRSYETVRRGTGLQPRHFVQFEGRRVANPHVPTPCFHLEMIENNACCAIDGLASSPKMGAKRHHKARFL